MVRIIRRFLHSPPKSPALCGIPTPVSSIFPFSRRYATMAPFQSKGAEHHDAGRGAEAVSAVERAGGAGPGGAAAAAAGRRGSVHPGQRRRAPDGLRLGGEPGPPPGADGVSQHLRLLVLAGGPRGRGPRPAGGGGTGGPGGERPHGSAAGVTPDLLGGDPDGGRPREAGGLRLLPPAPERDVSAGGGSNGPGAPEARREPRRGLVRPGGGGGRLVRALVPGAGLQKAQRQAGIVPAGGGAVGGSGGHVRLRCLPQRRPRW